MPKGKARYPAFQMDRKHITALSPTQRYTPKRASTPLIHIRCILTRFPSWLRYQQRLLGGRSFGLSRPDQQRGSSGWRICRSWCLARSSSSPLLGSRLKSSIQSNTYYTHAKRESAVPSIPDAQGAHHRAFPHANVHPKAHPHPTHPRQMHTAALSLLASE